MGSAAFNTSVPSEDCEINWSEGASVALLLVVFCNNASNVEFIELLDVVGRRRSLLLLVGEIFDSEVTSEAGPGLGVSVSVESSLPVVVSTSVSVVLLVTMLLSVTLLLLTGTSETLTSTASD